MSKRPSQLYIAALFLSSILWIGVLDHLFIRTNSLLRAVPAAAIELPELPVQQHSFCHGRRVYMYDLPVQFNSDLVQKCDCGILSWYRFCEHVANHGLGQALNATSTASLLGDGWYATDWYMLDLIFHDRMRRYRCLTRDSSKADAFFVPYYAGLDALHYLYHVVDEEVGGKQGMKLVRWLEENAGDTFKRYGARDHFMAMGRTAWDFGDGRNWGTRMTDIPQIANMTSLLVERNPWLWRSQTAVPYPTSFHPATKAQLVEWTRKVRRAERVHLFSLAGGYRPMMNYTIRLELFQQCSRAPNCNRVDCDVINCEHDPAATTVAFLRSKFCLQPPGDSATRRSTFDAMVAGCIPVFFRNDSAYTQYIWHLPQDASSYSVYISEESVRNGTKVEDVLLAYSEDRILRLRERIISLIPNFLYVMRADAPVTEKSNDDLNQIRDAFDISVDGALEKIVALKSQTSST